MTNFKITGKSSPSKQSHYVVQRGHEDKVEQKVDRLSEKLNKHINLPMEKAHQPSAGMPHLRK